MNYSCLGKLGFPWIIVYGPFIFLPCLHMFCLLYFAFFILQKIHDYYCAQIKSTVTCSNWQWTRKIIILNLGKVYTSVLKQINKRIALTTSGVEAPSVCEVLSALLRLSESEVSLWLTSSKHTKKITEGHVFQKNMT